MAHHEEQPTAIESVLELLSEHGLGAMAEAMQTLPNEAMKAVGKRIAGINAPFAIIPSIRRSHPVDRPRGNPERTTYTDQAKQALVLDWVRLERMSVRKGAELLGLSYRSFLDVLADHRVPVCDYEEGWLDREFEGSGSGRPGEP